MRLWAERVIYGLLLAAWWYMIARSQEYSWFWLVVTALATLRVYILCWQGLDAETEREAS